MYLKDILIYNNTKKDTCPLVTSIYPITQWLDTENLTFLYDFILGNYDLKKAKFLTIRAHDQFIFGKFKDKFGSLYYTNEDLAQFLWNEVYEQTFSRILNYVECSISIEYNNVVKFPSYIHFHLCLFNITNNRFKDIIKSFKSEYSCVNNFYYLTHFNVEAHIPDRAVVPKTYKIDEKHFALLYYLGFDKRSITNKLRSKDSYFMSYYFLKKSEKDFNILNLVYRLFPYNMGCKKYNNNKCLVL